MTRQRQLRHSWLCKYCLNTPVAGVRSGRWRDRVPTFPKRLARELTRLYAAFPRAAACHLQVNAAP